MIDDRELRDAAERLLRAVRRARPVVQLAQHVVDGSEGAATFLVECRIGSAGAIGSTIVLDSSGTNEQPILWCSLLDADCGALEGPPAGGRTFGAVGSRGRPRARWRAK
jgi:hypothetical protein